MQPQINVTAITIDDIRGLAVQIYEEEKANNEEMGYRNYKDQRKRTDARDRV